MFIRVFVFDFFTSFVVSHTAPKSVAHFEISVV